MKNAKSRFGYLFLTSQVEATRRPRRWATHRAATAARGGEGASASARLIALAGLLGILAAVYLGFF